MKKKSMLVVLLLCLTLAVMSGCNTEEAPADATKEPVAEEPVVTVTEETLNDTLETRDPEALVADIATYYEEDNQDTLNPIVVDAFNTMAAQTEYTDFEYMRSVLALLSDDNNKQELQEIYDDNFSNEVIAFLTSDEWVRTDVTALDGLIIKPQFASEAKFAAVTSSENCINNAYGFAVGDLKWDNIVIVDRHTIKYDELSRDANGPAGYTATLATIDYEAQSVTIPNDGHIWIRKSYLDSFSSINVITDDDFIITDDQTGETVDLVDAIGLNRYNWQYYFYDADIDPEDEDGNPIVITTSRGIHIGSSYDEVFDAYGLGGYREFSEDGDSMYLAIKIGAEEYGDQVSKMAMEKLSAEAKYYVSYVGENRFGKNIRFYFDENDKVMFINFANEYPGAHIEFWSSSDGSSWEEIIWDMLG